MPALSISAFVPSTTALNFSTLTIDGLAVADWVIPTAIASFEQKASVSLLSERAVFGGTATFNGGATQGTTLSWTSDGTPTASGSNSAAARNDVFNSFESNGWSFTATVGTGERKLRVFFGRYSESSAAGVFAVTASISDGSTGDQTLNIIGVTSDQDGYVDITVAAASAGQTLTVVVKSNTTASNFFRTINLRGYWLSEEAAGGGVAGTSATTNSDDVSAASGTTTILGSSATTNADDTSSASATTTVIGTSAITDSPDVSDASGSIGEAVSGTSATTNSSDTSNASGTTTVIGSSATTNADDVSSASGTTTILGTSATTDSADVGSSSGTTSVTGSSATTNAVDTSNASGVVGGGVIGSSATTNAPDVSSASGNITILGSASINEGADRSSANGQTPIIDSALSGGFFEYPERRRPKQYDDGYVKPDIPEKVKEVVAKVVKEVPENRQERAFKAFLRDENIRFRQTYLDELKKELIRDYLLQMQARKQEEETIVFMMMSLMN
jgi:hypothetical protein